MTIAELIALLQPLDPTLLVVVRGYENGYDDARVPSVPFELALNTRQNDRWWDGQHEDAALLKAREILQAASYETAMAICL